MNFPHDNEAFLSAVNNAALLIAEDGDAAARLAGRAYEAVLEQVTSGSYQQLKDRNTVAGLIAHVNSIMQDLHAQDMSDRGEGEE